MIWCWLCSSDRTQVQDVCVCVPCLALQILNQNKLFKNVNKRNIWCLHHATSSKAKISWLMWAFPKFPLRDSTNNVRKKKIGFIYLLLKWLMDSNCSKYDNTVLNRTFPPWNIATSLCAIEPQRFGKLFKNLCQVETVDRWFIQKQRYLITYKAYIPMIFFTTAIFLNLGGIQ